VERMEVVGVQVFLSLPAPLLLLSTTDSFAARQKSPSSSSSSSAGRVKSPPAKKKLAVKGLDEVSLGRLSDLLPLYLARRMKAEEGGRGRKKGETFQLRPERERDLLLAKRIYWRFRI